MRNIILNQKTAVVIRITQNPKFVLRLIKTLLYLYHRICTLNGFIVWYQTATAIFITSV